MGSRIKSAKTLMSMELPETRWAVPGLLPEGLIVLAGKQKMGKSFLLLNIGLAVARGGKVMGVVLADQGRALYLALEDGHKRLQDRLRIMLDGSEAPDTLDLATEWDKLDAGGVDALEDYLKQNEDTKVIMIDVLQRVIPKHKQNADSYEEAYTYLSPLKQLAERYHVAIVVVQHMRKAAANDVLDEIYGSTGLSAVADTIVILSKENSRNEKFLLVKGRDVSEQKYALEFDEELATWRIVANGEQAEELLAPSELGQFVKLVNSHPDGITRTEVANELGKTVDSVDSLAKRAMREEKIKRDRGVYTPFRKTAPAPALIFDDNDPD
ncbi:MAG TPA: AAA family ATPase [Ktedonobacteraceae bacterium]|jgi:hypothetical protein|nr:AAA family ATPase [Ktedonobacteraceae bacterium]